MGVHPPCRRLGAVAVDGISRRLLRQRHGRVVLEPHAGRASRPSAMAHPDRTSQRDLRVPRDVPQPPAAPLCPWHAHTRRVRSSTPTDDSSLKNPTTRLHGSRGTPQQSRNPGRFRHGRLVGPASTAWDAPRRSPRSGRWPRPRWWGRHPRPTPARRRARHGRRRPRYRARPRSPPDSPSGPGVSRWR